MCFYQRINNTLIVQSYTKVLRLFLLSISRIYFYLMDFCMGTPFFSLHISNWKQEKEWWKSIFGNLNPNPILQKILENNYVWTILFFTHFDLCLPKENLFQRILRITLKIPEIDSNVFWFARKIRKKIDIASVLVLKKFVFIEVRRDSICRNNSFRMFFIV